MVEGQTNDLPSYTKPSMSGSYQVIANDKEYFSLESWKVKLSQCVLGITEARDVRENKLETRGVKYTSLIFSATFHSHWKLLAETT